MVTSAKAGTRQIQHEDDDQLVAQNQWIGPTGHFMGMAGMARHGMTASHARTETTNSMQLFLQSKQGFSFVKLRPGLAILSAKA